jgi:hypothetical protein
MSYRNGFSERGHSFGVLKTCRCDAHGRDKLAGGQEANVTKKSKESHVLGGRRLMFVGLNAMRL